MKLAVFRVSCLLVFCCLFASEHGLALEWQVGPGYRWAPLPVPTVGKTGFTQLAPQAIGIDFVNDLDEARMEKFQNLMNGSGLAAVDVDGDGLVDLYFCHRQASNQLYRNLGNGLFTNITAAAGVGCTNQTSSGALFADFNGDGAPDLFVSGFGGPNAYLVNDGHGHFSDRTTMAGLAGKSGGTSMAAADLTGSGSLDLYRCNYGVEAILRDGAVINTRTINGQTVVTGRYAKRLRILNGRIVEIGDAQDLFLNDGHGNFRPSAWEEMFRGVDGRPFPVPHDLGLSVQIRDVNGDGWPDIFTCNDFQTPDHLWLGDGHGHFQEAVPTALRNMSNFSMGVDFADIDRDGRLDFFTVDMLHRDFALKQRNMPPPLEGARIPGDLLTRENFSRNCLYWNRGDGSWAEIACFAGVAATSWSWMPMFLDVDLDGWEDLLISNGYPHDVNDRDIDNIRVSGTAMPIRSIKGSLAGFPRLGPPKVAYRNRRNLTFEDASATWGFDTTAITHGMIAVDIDGDGDLDVVLNSMKGPPIIYRNDTVAPRVAVRLRGKTPNTAGIGATITLMGGPVTQSQEMISGGQYLSQSEPMRVFAAGTNSGFLHLEVRWRNGRMSHVEGVRPNCLYEVEEPSGTLETMAVKPEVKPIPLLGDATAALHHEHVELGFDDLVGQPLLPRRLSQLGPMVVLADINDDGHIDVIVGGSQGGHPAVRLGDGQGGFRELEFPGAALQDDVLGLACVSTGGGRKSILAAFANYKSGDRNQASVLRWDWVNGTLIEGKPLPSQQSSPGVLASGDLDGDGQTDLFVGGRVNPGRWPEVPTSRIYRQLAGEFILDEANSAVIGRAGMVTGAAWADLDGDGRPELVVCTECGPIRVYHNNRGKLVEHSLEVGLANQIGWWHSLAVADLDGDGKPDLVVGNLGLNSSWQIWGDGHPVVVSGDFVGDGTIKVMEAIGIEGRVYPWRDRTTLGAAMPDLLARYPTHALFAKATVNEILGRANAQATTVRLETLASTVYLRRGEHFEAHPLPVLAQWAPATAIVVGDVNGDGKPDLFLAQNWFAMRPEDNRMDAGQGLWLTGDGHGEFRPLSAQESGVQVWGEQRSAAWGDVTGDGKPDLIVTQNGAATRLFVRQ